MVDARQQPGVAADVVALLARLEAAAHHQVVGLGEVDLGVAVDERLERHRGEVVRTDVLERPLTARPIGVRTASTMTASGMGSPVD